MNRFFNTLIVALSLFWATSANAQTLTFAYSPAVITGNIGDTITIKAVARNFIEIQSFQYSHSWDTAKLKFVNLVAGNFNTYLPLSLSNNFAVAPQAMGVTKTSVTVIWADTQYDGLATLPAGDSVLYAMRFVIKGANPWLNYFDAPVPMEFTKTTDNKLIPIVINLGSGTLCELAYNAVPTSPTCTNNVPNSNGKIRFTGVNLMRPGAGPKPHGGYSLGTTYTGLPFATAPELTLQSSAVDLVNTLPNPATPVQYTVRLYRSQVCFKDTTVTLAPATCLGVGCVPPVFGVAVTPATCTGTVANSNAIIQLTGVNAGTTARASFSLGGSYTGAAYASAPAVPANGILVSNLANPAAATQYTVRVFRDATCFKDMVVTLSSTVCNGGCTPPNFTVSTTQATCTGTTANADARICIAGYPSGAGVRVGFSVGATYTGAAYTGASAVPANGCIVTNLANPAAATQYIIRLFTSATCFTDKTVTLQSTSCGGLNSPLIVTVANDSAAPCATRCVEVKVSNFTNISGFQFAIRFNASKLQFLNIKTSTQPDSLSGSISFNTTGAPSGIIRTNYYGDSPETRANGTTIFSICFKVIGNGGDTAVVVGTAVVASNPALNFPMEAYREPQGGGSPVTVDITPQPGVFKITGTGSGVSCNNNFTLRASLESALPGDTVCVKVTADNFNSITGMQFGMSWNPAVIQLIPAIKFPNPPALPSLTQSNFNANNSSTGVLKFQWASGVPVTLPNGTTLFELCFAVVGTTGQSTDIKFIDVPAALPIPALKIEILNQIGEIPFDLAGGKVTVGINNSSAFQVKADTVTIEPNGVVCVPIRVRGFNNISGMQYSMAWDTNIIKLDTFIVSDGGNPMGISPAYAINFGSRIQAKEGKFPFLWDTAEPNGLTLADGTIVYKLCFRAFGNLGASAPILFGDVPLSIGLAGFVPNPNPNLPDTLMSISDQFSSAPGLVNINVPMPMPLGATTTVTNLTCFDNSTGAITVNVTGGRPPFSYDWQDLPPLSDPQNRVGLAAGTYSVTITDALADVKVLTGIIVGQPNPIRTNAVTTSTNGSTGTITLNTTGGTSPYTYNWADLAPASDAPNRTALAVGSYKVVITDSKNCTKDTAFAIVPSITILTDSTVNVKCFGGTTGAIYVSVGGSGTPPYTYAWSDLTATTPDPEDRTGLAAGTYTLTLSDASGGGVSQTFTLTSPPDITINVTGTTQTPNGTVNITVAGGVPSYTYVWTGPPGFLGATTQNLSGLNRAGTYTVTVRDANNCIKTAIAVVAQGTLPISVAGVTDSVSCFGLPSGKIVQTVSEGCAPYTYAWSVTPVVTTKDLIGVVAGNYTCTITDICGQTEVRNYTIYSKSSAPLSISLNNVVCETGNTAGLGNKDGKIYLQQPTGGKAPYIFDWKDLGPNEPQEGSRDRLAVESAKYMVCVTDKNGCMVSSDTIVVPFCPAPLAVKNIVIKPVKCFGDDNGEVSFKIEGGHATYVIKWGAAPNQTTTSSDGNVSILNLAGGNYAFTVTFDYKGSSGSFVQNVIVPSPSSAIKIDTAIVRCAKTATAPCNGSIDLTVSGGTLPFTYNWDGGTQTTQDIIDCPSTHKVTITDARGCVLVSPVYNIGLCVPLSITGVVTNIKCANGTEGAINITVSGGSGSYIYNWGTATSEDLTAITSGIYTVTVTDANAPNALGTATFTVSVISTLGVTVSVFGTTANAVVTGGIGNPNNYIYQWGGLPTSPDTNVVTGLSSGVYNVMVTDSLGCSVTTVFTIDAVLSATVVVQKTVSCYKVCDGRAVVTNVIGGTPPYTFKWDNGSTGNNFCVGTHTVTITDGAQRNVIQQFNVDGPTDSLNVVVQTVGITVSGGADGTATATVTGGTSPYTFQWNDLARTKTQVVTNLPVGDLAVVVVDKNGCTAVGIGKVAGIGSNCFDTGKTFTPNGDGLNDEFLINTCDNLQPLTFQIFNRWGQLVYDIKASPTGIWSAWDGKDQSGSDLPEGGYFYVIEVTQSGVTKQYKGSLTLLRQ